MKSFNYKYWILFLIILGGFSLGMIFLINNEIVNAVGIEVLGATVFVVLLSIVFKRMLKKI